MDNITLYALDCESRLFTNLKVLDYCYLHGKIEEDNGYDLVGVEEETLKYLSVTCKDSIIDCTVWIKDTEKECNFYFWHTTMDGIRINRGLIVYKDDEVNNRLAKSKFEVRAKIL